MIGCLMRVDEYDLHYNFPCNLQQISRRFHENYGMRKTYFLFFPKLGCSYETEISHLSYPEKSENFTCTLNKWLRFIKQCQVSELNVDNWNDDCEAKSEAKVPGLYAVSR